MKKTFFFLAFFLAIAISNAQLPNFWTGDIDIDLFQETTTVHGGSSSCGVIVKSGTQANCDLNNTEAIAVTAGNTYKVSFWAYTSTNVRITALVDWVGASSVYNNTYVGPATGGWVQFEWSDVVPAGATAGKIHLRFYDVAGFVAPETCYVDDVAFQSPTGTNLAVPNGNFEAWPNIKPEPSNYPTQFSATPLGLNIALSWIDAVGAQLPDAYLILASKQDNITAPADGVFVVDDLDLADGTGAANIAFGIQAFSFAGLEAQTTYYFKIYPYTNSGTNINFKNSGTAPSAQATTTNVSVINSQNFDGGWGNWTTVSVIGDQVWSNANTFGINATPCAQMSGYAGGDFANEDWLISPAMNFYLYNNEVFTFYSALGYPIANHQLHVKISNEYTGGNPNDANWTDLNPILPSGNPFWVFTYSGELAVSGVSGTNVRVAFVYISDGTTSETWEIDNVIITGETGPIAIPESNLSGDGRLAISPNPANGNFTLSLPSETNWNVEVFEFNGRLVYSTSASSSFCVMNAGSLPKGIYLLKASSVNIDKVLTNKLIIN